MGSWSAAFRCCILALILGWTADGAILQAAPKSILPTAPKSAGREQVLFPTDQSITNAIEEVRRKLDEALVSLGALLQVPTQIVAGAQMSPMTMVERRRLASEIVRNYEQQANYLRRLAEVRRSAHDQKVAADSWQGFAGTPPYPLSLVDELRQQLQANQRQRELIEEEQKLLAARIEERRVAVTQKDRDLRQMVERIESTKDLAQAAGLREEKEQMQWRVRAGESSLAVDQFWREANEEQMDVLRADEQLLRRKLQVALDQVQFTAAEKDARLSEVARQRELVGQEIDRAILGEREASRALAQAREALREALEKAAATTANAVTEVPSIQTLQQVVDSRKIQADAARLRLELLNWQLSVLAAQQRLWEDRFQFANPASLPEVEARLGEIARNLDQGRSWLRYLTTRRAAVRALLEEQQRIVAAWKPEAGNIELAREVQSSYAAQEQDYLRLEEVLRQSISVGEQLQEDLAGKSERPLRRRSGSDSSGSMWAMR